MLDERRGQQISPAERSEVFIVRAFARLDRTAFGVAVGALLGLLIFAATLFVISKSGAEVRLYLGLLSQYYPGYTVTVGGAVLGLVYGFVSGFLLGWFIALLRNASLPLLPSVRAEENGALSAE
jgi:hypothetical protein